MYSLVVDCMSNVQSNICGSCLSRSQLLAATCLWTACAVVIVLVAVASTNTLIVYSPGDYMPGVHSPDGQANVNMKSLEQSMARYLSSKRYAIDFKETKLQKVSYTGL